MQSTEIYRLNVKMRTDIKETTLIIDSRLEVVYCLSTKDTRGY